MIEESVSLSSSNNLFALKRSQTILSMEKSYPTLCNSKLIVFINYKLRTSWNIIQTLIILYYIISIPIRFPFIVQNHDNHSSSNNNNLFALLIIDYICDFLLFIDLILNTFYFHIIKTTNIGHNDYIRKPNEIFYHYTTSSIFKYDILSIIPFEIIVFILNCQTFFVLFRLNKLFRIIHLKQIHLPEIEKLINKTFSTSLQSASYRLIYLIITFLITTHWFTCIWFTIGEYQLDNNHNNGWMYYDTPIPNSFSRKYARSYYWATITLVTTGYGDIHPKSNIETIYLLFVMMIAVSLCTAIIASFASIFANGNIALWEHEQRMEVIQQYMQWKHLPNNIQQTVTDYFHYLWSTNDGIQEKTILNKIPWHLRKDIMIYIEGEALNRCSLFRTMDSNFIASLSMLLTPVLLSPGHYIYRKGQSADSMWLLYRGKCEKLNEKGRVEQVLEDNSFFGETALLGVKFRNESIRTITFTHLYVLKKDDFTSLLKIITHADKEKNNKNEIRNSLTLQRSTTSNTLSITTRQSTLQSTRKSLLRQSFTMVDELFDSKKTSSEAIIGDNEYDDDDEDEKEEKIDEDLEEETENATNDSSSGISSEYHKILSQMKKSYESDLKMKTKVNKFFGAMDEAPPQKPRCSSICVRFRFIDLKKIFHPKSSFMKSWNSLHFLVVFYSFIVYPYRSAFLINDYRDWSVNNQTFIICLIIDIITDIFWYFDFYLRCQHFGYNVSRGSLKYIVYNPSEILLKYKENNKMKYDLISIMPFEYILCFSGIVPMEFFSIIRCKVLIKWFCYLDEWKHFLLDTLEGILSLNALRLIILFIKIVLFGHILACIWYFIGYLSNESLNRPVSDLIVDITDSSFSPKVWFDFDELHFSTQFRRYIRSLYWSFITITTTGYGDIRGYTNLESWYAGTCVFLGGMVYYGAVGQISSLITKMSWMERNFFQRKDDLETFMKIKKLPLNITQRVRNYYSYMWDRQRGFEESAILNEFPRSLQSEVTKALNQTIVSCIPLFADCDESVIKEITSVLEYRVHIPGDNIVSPNEMATEMFIVNRGWAEIFEVNDEDDDDKKDNTLSLGLLSDGCWYGHTDFITQERRYCYIKAITFCDISVLSVDDLCAVMTHFPSSEKTILHNVKKQKRNHENKLKALKKNLENEKIEEFLGDRDKSLFTSTTSKSKKIIHPQSFKKTIWTGVILCLMIFNTLEIPLFMAFVPSQINGIHFIITLVLHIFADTVGIVNIWLSYYRFGFEQEGQIIVDPDLIKERFWKNKHNKYELIAFLPIDYLLLILLLLTPVGDSLSNPLQIIAFIRCLRLISLSQFFKYTNWLQIKIQESSKISISTNLFYFIQLFVLLGLIAHWCGLLFFIIAKLVDDANVFNGYDKSWITKDLQQINDDGLYSFNPIIQYLRSFYWALSTMTVVCFGDVTPQKDLSTIYVTIVVIMCFFMVGNIIGNIGDLLGRIDAASAELKTRSDQFDVFASSHSLPDVLIQRVKLYLNELYQTKKGINTAKIMSDFPPALKNQVMMHLFTPLLLNTAYFSFIEKNLIEKLSQYLEYELYVEHDFLCVYDEPADKIQILENGKVKILDQNNFLITILDQAGDIIGDISFFLNANRKSASIQAATFVECVSLNKDRFRKVFISCPAYLDKMKDIALKKKQRIIEINTNVHNNLKRLVRKNKLHKFADLGDALPSDIRQHLMQIESRNLDRVSDSAAAYSRLSTQQWELKMAAYNIDDENDANDNNNGNKNDIELAEITPQLKKQKTKDNNSNRSPLSRKSSELSRKSTDILQAIFEEELEDEIAAQQTERQSYLLNLYRGWDGFVAIIILIESMLIWFRLCFYSAYKNDMKFKNSFILITLIMEYIFEIIFFIDIFWIKCKVLPPIIKCHRIMYKNFSFYCDIFSILPFEILLIFPLIISDLNVFQWMIWLRLPKLLRLRSFQWNNNTENGGDNKDNDNKNKEINIDLTETYIYKTSLNDRLINLEKFLSYYSISIFLWRYISFTFGYVMGAHYMGGLWYLVGVWGESYYHITWIIRDKTQIYIDEHNNGVIDLYLRSTYFCLNAMTTTGYGDIACSNPIETVFLLILIIVSVIMFASMVGLFQNATMESDQHLARFQLQIEYTKSFLKRHRVSTELNKRALQHFDYIWNRSKGVDESAVLGSLPSSLKGDIVLFMNKNLLQNVSWFKKCSRGFVRSIATRLETHLFLSKEIIFKTGNIGQHMFFINQGIIEIVLDNDNNADYNASEDRSIALKSGDFFGHESVINNTPRTYTAVANTVCELLSLSSAKFNELLDYEPDLPQMLEKQDIIQQILEPSSYNEESGDKDYEINADFLDKEDENVEENADNMVRIEITNDNDQEQQQLERKTSFTRQRSLSDVSRNSLNNINRDSNSSLTRTTRHSVNGLFTPPRNNSSSSTSRTARHSAANLLSGFQEIGGPRESTMSMASFDVINTFRRKLSAHSKESIGIDKEQ